MIDLCTKLINKLEDIKNKREMFLAELSEREKVLSTVKSYSALEKTIKNYIEDDELFKLYKKQYIHIKEMDDTFFNRFERFENMFETVLIIKHLLKNSSDSDNLKEKILFLLNMFDDNIIIKIFYKFFSFEGEKNIIEFINHIINDKKFLFEVNDCWNNAKVIDDLYNEIVVNKQKQILIDNIKTFNELEGK